MKKLLVLSKPNCVGCAMVKGHLDNNGIHYDTINGMENLDVIEKYEIMSFPVTLLLNEDNIEVSRVIGSDLIVLDELIAQL